MMDGAGCDLFLWLGFVGKVGAYLPRRLVDHGLRIALIQVSVGKNWPRIDDEDVQMEAAPSAAFAYHDMHP